MRKRNRADSLPRLTDEEIAQRKARMKKEGVLPPELEGVTTHEQWLQAIKDMETREKESEMKKLQSADAALQRWQTKLEKEAHLVNGDTPADKSIKRRGDWILEIRESRQCPHSNLQFGRAVSMMGSEDKHWNMKHYSGIYNGASSLCYAADSGDKLYPGKEDHVLLSAAGVQYEIRFDPPIPRFHAVAERARHLEHLGYKYRFTGKIKLISDIPGAEKLPYNPGAVPYAQAAPKPEVNEIKKTIAELRAELDRVEDALP